MKTLSAFILGIFFPIIVFSQTPIWKSIHVAPSNNISLLPSPNGKPFGLQYSQGRIYVWNEEQKRWIIRYNSLIDYQNIRVHSVSHFEQHTLLVSVHKEDLSQKFSKIRIEACLDGSETWEVIALPDTITELIEKFSKSIPSIGGSIFVGMDNKIYYVTHFVRKEGFPTQIVDSKMMFFSKTSIDAPWIKEPDIPSHFFYNGESSYDRVFWGTNNYFIQSSVDTLLIYGEWQYEKNLTQRIAITII